MSGGLFNVERVYATPGLAGNNGQRVQAAGVITRFGSSTDFDINNTAASVNAGTSFLNGDAGNLALNAELTIDGDFAAGGRISANRITFGHLVHDTAALSFDFNNFTEISVPTVFNVTVTQGPDFSVEITVDEEAANRIDVTQIGSRLSIALLTGDGYIQTLQAHVTMPVLNTLDLTGVVNATLNDFNQPEMTVNVGGVSRLYGNALTIEHLTAHVSGVSQLAFGDIRPIGNADIDINGVSQATLNMRVGSTMTGSVGTGQGTGVSTLFYYGTNVTVDIATDFLSSVIKLGETRP
ncbi:MAG: GIN domain-containing protein, partial [Woeseiaceae bacterium]